MSFLRAFFMPGWNVHTLHAAFLAYTHMWYHRFTHWNFIRAFFMPGCLRSTIRGSRARKPAATKRPAQSHIAWRDPHISYELRKAAADGAMRGWEVWSSVG